jgi:hypothetical protein
VVEDPNGPPTPKPDFDVPVLGPLPACTLPAVVPGSATASEAAGTLQIPVSLSAPSTETVTAAWSTVDPARLPAPAASEGSDFTPSSGTVTFAPGQTTATVSVPIVDDGDVEADELVAVSLTGTIDATVGGFWGLGIGAIQDDDQPTVVPGTTTAVEGDNGVTVVQVPVHLDRPSTGAVTVDWATVPPDRLPTAAAGAEDFVAASGTVTFLPGQTDATVPVSIVGDHDPEAPSYVVVSFTNPSGARLGGFLGLGAVFLTDDD